MNNAKKPNAWVDAVYVLSVKTFTDRISHITRELNQHNIPFEFIFEHDIPTLSRDLINLYFASPSETGPGLTPAHQSLILKHITAWQKAINNHQHCVLILEDDVVLHKDFKKKLAEVLKFTQTISPGFLVFLGGADTRMPSAFFLESDPIFKHSIATADGYLSDHAALTKRLAWIKDHLIDLPADHLIKRIDQEVNIDQYWSTTPLVQQGSVFGLFTSTLDKKRQRKSLLRNRLSYHFKIMRRRTLPSFLVRFYAKFTTHLLKKGTIK